MGTTEQEIRRDMLRRRKEQDRINEEAVKATETSHKAALAQAEALDEEAAAEASKAEKSASKAPAAKQTSRR
jgi:hypothetical protein